MRGDVWRLERRARGERGDSGCLNSLSSKMDEVATTARQASEFDEDEDEEEEKEIHSSLLWSSSLRWLVLFLKLLLVTYSASVSSALLVGLNGRPPLLPLPFPLPFPLRAFFLAMRFCHMSLATARSRLMPSLTDE